MYLVVDEVIINSNDPRVALRPTHDHYLVFSICVYLYTH